MVDKKKSNIKKKSSREDIFVSAVIIATASEKLDSYVKKLSTLLNNHYNDYEIILVDDGNGLKKETIGALLDVPCVRIIRLAPNLKYDVAIFAGLEVSIGDYVCTVDPRTDPLKDIPKIIRESSTCDVVQGVSTIPFQGSWFTRLGRKAFYWYGRKYIGIDVPLYATYFAVYSRRAINSLMQSTRSQRHIRHLARRVGYAYDTFQYKPLDNPIKDRRLRAGLLEAFEISISYSTHPLRFVTFMGLFAAFVNVLYAVYVGIVNVFNKHIAEGWTTTSLQLSLMFFILFIVVVVISEYIGRILTESYKEPHYYITDELNSTVALVDRDRRNVTK